MENIKIKLPKQGDSISARVDDSMIIEIKRADVGYIIDVWDKNYEKLIDTLTVWDDDLGIA